MQSSFDSPWIVIFLAANCDYILFFGHVQLLWAERAIRSGLWQVGPRLRSFLPTGGARDRTVTKTLLAPLGGTVGRAGRVFSSPVFRLTVGPACQRGRPGELVDRHVSDHRGGPCLSWTVQLWWRRPLYARFLWGVGPVYGLRPCMSLGTSRR
jgi:hypothetical protein